MTDYKNNPRMGVKGYNDSEEYVQYLCKESFFAMWSYPNIFTDKGKNNERATGRELCDVLVVYDDYIIIISVKSIGFSISTPVAIAWKRWVKKAVFKSTKQIYGAERWLREHSDRIYLDQRCSQAFPIDFPKSIKRVYRVCVALGIHNACSAYFGGSSLGSLIISSDLSGESIYSTPFTIGQPYPEKGYVHIFDDLTFLAVMRELDTITDFLLYLNKKEALFERGKPLITAAGEEQLLSIYLTNTNDSGEHDFSLPKDVDRIYLDESFWEDMINNPQYLRKKDDDKQSYMWDKLINKFASEGRKIREDGELGSHDTRYLEKGLKIMAAEQRVHRRLLAKSIMDMVEKYRDRDNATRVIFPSDRENFAYVFLMMKPIKDYSKYRTYRRGYLMTYMEAVKSKYRNINLIVGIAFDNPEKPPYSEDLVVMDVSNWTDEEYDSASEVAQRLNMLNPKNLIKSGFGVSEYPD